MPTISLVQDPPPPEEPLKPEIATDDQRYFFLSEPISVAGKTIDKLLIDTSTLSGPSYFKAVRRFRTEHPDIARSAYNKMGEDIFLAYALAELNPPMVVEDVAKIDFDSLATLFLRMQSFYYSAQAEKEEKRKKALMATNGQTVI